MLPFLTELLALSLVISATTLGAGETAAPTKRPARGQAASRPKVLFSDDFEGPDLSAWGEQHGTAKLSTDRPHAGRKCLAIPMHRGKDTGGHLIKWFMPGADTAHVRFYVRFSKNYQYIHHFVTLMGAPPNDRWRPFGKAGLKPDGTYFGSGMEPWFAWGKNPPPGELNFYSYFVDMEIDRKMNKYWGNSFFPPGPGKGEAAGQARVIPPLDQWQCWEFALQANSAPDKADGQQTMWVNGRLIGRFEGIRWRTDPKTKVNILWLQHYGYDESDPTKEYWKDDQTVWFDDVVVATGYVGPSGVKSPTTATAEEQMHERQGGRAED